MGRNLDDVIKSLPADRQQKIAALSEQKVAEMLAHAATLTDIRKAVGQTQATVAKELGIKQHAVSQLESRSDTYVSTLRRFLKSLGLTLEMSVVAKGGARIDLPKFFALQDAISLGGSSKFGAVAKKSVAKVKRARRANTVAKTAVTKKNSRIEPVPTRAKRKSRATAGKTVSPTR